MRYGKVGLTEYDRARATPGFTLFSPLQIPVAYLMGMRGEVVHRWNLDAPTGNYGYLLPSGNLLAAVKTETGPKGLSAQGGRIQELDWDGNLAWEYVDHYQHHDFRRCANGNTVYLGWELLSAEAAGRVKGGVPGSEHEDGI
ncbi:MAG: aryl sulfotransferase, partial [Rhodospirillales bacterium]|nr:aryl sulfotransferase [Rhodospirillales bacterium]